MDCKICGGYSPSWSRGRILKKYEVQYFRCEQCGFIQTEEPYWLNELYDDAIARNDIGLASRNIGMARLSRSIILSFFDCNRRFLDYGGGYGLFARLMRDKGFNFFLCDKFAPNLFAQGFEADVERNRQYELVTAFEVFEHLTDPLDEISNMLQFSPNILFSTFLVPDPPPALESWWYYSLEQGQHIAFYTLQSLTTIAKKFNLHLYSNNISFHLFTEKRLSQATFGFISKRGVSNLVSLLLSVRLSKRSYLASDYFKLTGMNIN